jgi:hypothetical protein
MKTSEREELLARRMAGEDVAAGEPQVTTEPMQSAGDVKIGKSLRVPFAVFERVAAAAERRGMSWSALVRQWILEGLDRDEAGVKVDPVTEAQRHLEAANQALRTLRSRQVA